ncbi:hypothetical protein MIND_00109700 [Mycena indigotica]|uniref:Uncharacterized protein n=1 Tax=Mycena indigotica TaxID=2126181 RepID=A0A8H6WEQ0_9AGAR|nr:uncharacterized protein MIND_00109700 [Mycena indigotica]KAF7315929.1 hypothetical protein MIND_00109700 [Mycena indigotica]
MQRQPCEARNELALGGYYALTAQLFTVLAAAASEWAKFSQRTSSSLPASRHESGPDILGDFRLSVDSRIRLVFHPSSAPASCRENTLFSRHLGGRLSLARPSLSLLPTARQGRVLPTTR